MDFLALLKHLVTIRLIPSCWLRECEYSSGLSSLIMVQTSVDIHLNLLHNQCMALRQVLLSDEWESTTDPEAHRSNRRALLPPDCLVVARRPWLYYISIDYVHRCKIPFSFPHGLRFLWSVLNKVIHRCSLTHRIGSALILNWVSNVVPRPPAKRSAAMGIVNGVANLSGVCVSCSVLQTIQPVDAYRTCSGWDHTYGRQSGARSTISRWSSH